MNLHTQITLLLLIVGLHAFAQEKFAVAEGQVLFDGYDPVSYFENAPEKGNEEYSINHEGRKIYFLNESNKQRFLLDSEKYFPTYGGWCSISMTKGLFVYPDYSFYKIQDGRLHFFAVKAFYNGKTAWEKDPELHQIIADKKYEEYFPEQ
ncbi:MAG: YHS domain-containing (seleno)protein [Cyclobacteriaceae bacterium]